MDALINGYRWIQEKGDPRVEKWLLMSSPGPVLVIYVTYLLTVWIGPKWMAARKAYDLKSLIIPYNISMVILAAYMCYEFFMSAYLAGYSLVCQPVDYSQNTLAIRMASVCWWYFFSKVIELLDTVFFILRKKNSQISFLHVYHHSTMVLNWWCGVKYIAGGQSFFLAMINSFIHVIMYSYYTLACFGPEVQKYLWWKKYLTTMQLSQFVIVIIHTGTNVLAGCDFPQGYNYAVIIYAITLILLFSNFYLKAYSKSGQKGRQNKKSEFSNGIANHKENETGQSSERYGAIANGDSLRKRDN